jgi:type I restriction enzyme M protein
VATVEKQKSLESWLWDAACSIRGAKEAAKYKDFILPLVFVKRLCDVYDDEINRMAKQVGSRAKAFKLAEHDKQLVRFYLPFRPEDPEAPVWSVIRTISDDIGEEVTTRLREISSFNPLLKGIIDRVDFNATTHGVRDLDDNRLSGLIEKISEKRLGLKDVEPDIIGRSYEYLIRKFAEGGGQSAGEFYTPTEVGMLIARIIDPEPGMTIYDPCCGSAGLLIKCQMVLEEKLEEVGSRSAQPLGIYGKEYTAGTWAMANMNMIIHNMEGHIDIGDSFKKPMLRDDGKTLRTFDRVVANPMWNQDWFTEADYDADELDRFPLGAGYPGGKADWGWMQVILASLNAEGRAAVVLDTGAASRGSGNAGSNKERDVRKWFIEKDLVEGVIYLPENLFYNTSAPGIIIFLNKNKTAEQKNKLFLVNASKEFAKGSPKNFLPESAVTKIASTVSTWQEEECFSQVVPVEEIARNDYNISPSRYIHTGVEQEYRPIAEIMDELEVLEEENSRLSQELREVMSALGVIA